MSNRISEQTDVSDVLQRQRAFFRDGGTAGERERGRLLGALRAGLQRHEGRILRALRRDLGKPETESYLTEIGVLGAEIRHLRRNFRKWLRPRPVRTPLPYFPARSCVYRRPYGSVLVLAPWNYPVLLSLSPAVGALAAGNTVVIKPSEVAPHSATALAELVADVFPPELCTVVTGGPDTARELTESPFDYIFYTGNTEIGRKVMHAAAERLVPVTLELGGKSPCIVTEEADLDSAARRIAWTKLLNAGQTCVAPDFLVCREEVAERMLELLEAEIERMYGKDPKHSPDYTRIVSERHTERLAQLLEGREVRTGGEVDITERYVAPTLVDRCSWEGDRLTQEEIFGPILPVLTYRDESELRERLQTFPAPLALYVFTRKQRQAGRIMSGLRFGGGCVNDCVVHLGSPHLPFGGVGLSGIGRYRGKNSLEAFSYEQGIMKRGPRPDPPFRYPPYRMKLSTLKRLFG